MRKKDFVIRQKIYNLLCMNYTQKNIVSLLEKQHYKIDKTRVSRIVKELIDGGHIRLQVKTKPNIYIITRRKYPPCQSLKRGGCFKHCHGKVEVQVAGEGEIRVHNQVLVFNVMRSSPVFDGDCKSLHWDRSWFGWDLIERSKRMGLTRFMYKTPEGVTIIRFKGRWGKDTLEVFLPDSVWSMEEFESYEEWFHEQIKYWEVVLERFFGIELEFSKANKPHYAISPLTPEMGRTFMMSNVTVGDIHGDASHGIPELEITDFNKAVEMMKMLDRMSKSAVEDRKRWLDAEISYQ